MAAIVYILENIAMPGYVKIGLTTTSVEQRMRELDNTAVPLPFRCYYAANVERPEFVEARLHTAFGDFRVRPNREWFKVDPYRVKAALELAALSEATPRADVLTDPSDAEALRAATPRQGLFTFSEVNIPVGSELRFARDETITAKVADDRRIEFEGQLTSLSRAALICLKRAGFDWTTVNGVGFWLFDGETLSERRERMRAAAEE